MSIFMFAYYCDYATELVDDFCYQLVAEVDQHAHPPLLYTAGSSLKSYRQECNKNKEINQNGGPALDWQGTDKFSGTD